MIQNLSEPRSVAIYCHIPFCRTHCTYCDFNVYTHLGDLMDAYAEALAREITTRGRTDKLAAHSIYFGGGTPSLAPITHIEKILRALADSFTVLPGAEITLEANPRTADLEKSRAYRALGINRLSLGVESFDDAVLHGFARFHTGRDAEETYAFARQAGFDNVNLDFIYGLPNQSLADWERTLDRARALNPEHFSLYALQIEPGTALERQIARGIFPRPDDDLAAEMYTRAQEKLDAAGYEQYEISNWARAGSDEGRRTRDGGRGTRDEGRMTRDELRILNFELRIPPRASRHNLTYWLNEPYLGFGAGAHSFFGHARFWNVLYPREYIKRVERGESAVVEREEIGLELEIAETMIVGLRLNAGVEWARVVKRFGRDAREVYRRELKELLELGLVGVDDARVRLTPRGRLVSNEVLWRFLPD